jgi:hypothetical protein
MVGEVRGRGSGPGHGREPMKDTHSASGFATEKRSPDWLERRVPVTWLPLIAILLVV